MNSCLNELVLFAYAPGPGLYYMLILSGSSRSIFELKGISCLLPISDLGLFAYWLLSIAEFKPFDSLALPLFGFVFQ